VRSRRCWAPSVRCAPLARSMPAFPRPGLRTTYGWSGHGRVGPMRTRQAGALLLLAMLGSYADALAQVLPTEPISIGDGRIVLGAEATATIAPEDEGFFNYTDYDYNTLRNVRLGLAAE